MSFKPRRSLGSCRPGDIDGAAKAKSQAGLDKAKQAREMERARKAAAIERARADREAKLAAAIGAIGGVGLGGWGFGVTSRGTNVSWTQCETIVRSS